MNKLGQIKELVKSPIQAAHLSYERFMDVDNSIDTSISERLLDASRVVFVGCDVIEDLGVGKPGGILVGTAFAGQIIDSVVAYRPLC